MPTLKIGDPAPDFTLQDANGQTVRLADLRGKKVMLYFYTSSGGGQLNPHRSRVPGAGLNTESQEHRRLWHER
jgi:hypothetical protein